MRQPQDLQEMLRPLRDIHSPQTVREMREAVFERMNGHIAAVSLWSQVRIAVVEALIVSVAITVLFGMALRFPYQGVNQAYRPSQIATGSSVLTENSGVTSHDFTARLNRPTAWAGEYRSSHARLDSVASLDAMTPVLPQEPVLFSTACPSPVAVLIPRSGTMAGGSRNAIASAITSTSNWFVSVQGGAMSSELWGAGERGELGFQDGWKTIVISYTNASAGRDVRDVLEHHAGIIAPFLSKKREQQFSLLFGATEEVGPLELRALVGPAYQYSSSLFYSPVALAYTGPVAVGAFGASADASVLYNVNNSLQMGITAVGSINPFAVHPAGMSGVLATLTYRFEP